MELHDALDDVFLLHQEALVERELELSAELLAAYRRLLQTHMRHEEQLILPLFERTGPVPRWPVVLYTGQHEKMLQLLSRAEAGLSELRTRKSDLRRGAIALITFEATYKHLAEHHDGAEREGLYPVVDRTTAPEEQQRLLLQIRGEWSAACDAERELISRARARLA